MGRHPGDRAARLPDRPERRGGRETALVTSDVPDDALVTAAAGAPPPGQPERTPSSGD
ncbi:hypothetical protein [Leifsonia xyli]|uniref:hypothetical protein n=1 Tax=Leifsonia xyli TaxID=1575 RepID=UPI00146FB183|nr:hypothetical protein [Leifsonia xyli]